MVQGQSLRGYSVGSDLADHGNTMAMAVPSRLWLGGVSSAQRDRHLIQALVQQVRASALTLALLVCVGAGQLCQCLP